MTIDEIEAFFLNHDGPIFEQIMKAKTFSKSLDLARMTLAEANIPVDMVALQVVVVKIRQQNEVIEKRMADTMKAREAIVAAAGPWKRGDSASGVITCPVCQGDLSYSRASVNGRIRARCSTAGCVAWME